ncbi:MAG: hypothetical protein WC515_03690 [Candidatus Omnitrophota bacterium]
MAGNDNMGTIRIFLAVIIITIIVIMVMPIILIREGGVNAPGASRASLPGDMEARIKQQMPSNAIPALEDIEESIGRRDSRRRELEAELAEFESEKERRANKPAEEAAAGTERPVAGKGAYPPERGDPVLPTKEDIKKMEERGVICY